MELNNLKRPSIKKKKKRLGKGEGSGFGKQAGKGHKGQKARAGGSIPSWFEGGQMPIQRRLPKKGFTNFTREHYRIVNLDRFMEFEETEFDIEKMERMGLIKKCPKNKYIPVKVLAGNSEELTKAIFVKADKCSKKAEQIVTDNGGKIEVRTIIKRPSRLVSKKTVPNNENK